MSCPWGLRRILTLYALPSGGYGYAGEEEDHIPHHAQPFQLVVGATHQECQAARVPIPVADGIPELDYSSGEQIQDDHECEAYICAPETHPDELLRLFPCGVGLHGSQIGRAHG